MSNYLTELYLCLRIRLLRYDIQCLNRSLSRIEAEYNRDRGAALADRAESLDRLRSLERPAQPRESVS